MPPPTIARLNVEVKVLDCDFRSHPCPRCGTESPRHDGAVRGVIDVNLDHPVVLLVHVGCYRCPSCQKGRNFRTPLPFVAPRWHFTLRARQKLTEAVDLDQMPILGAVARMQRDFHVAIAPSTGWEWHRAAAPTPAAVAEYQHLVAESFSGVLAVDEVYDGGMAILVATDPLLKRPVAYQLLEDVNIQKMTAFFQGLKDLGIEPEVVITDGSSLYPKALKAVWEKCRHQLCRFHWTRDLTREVLSGVKAYRETLPKAEKRKNPGRPRRSEQRQQEKLKAAQSARDEVRKGRFLLVARRENLTDEQQARLDALLKNHPPLAVARAFMDGFYGLFQGKPTPREAKRRRTLLLANQAYSASPYLAGALTILQDDQKFAKVCVFLSYANLDSTSNAPERDNRGLRRRQHTHFRIRSTKGLEILLRRRLLRQGPPDPSPTHLWKRFGRPSRRMTAPIPQEMTG